MKIFVITACHNRRDTTLKSLSALTMAARFADVDLRITLYDDASSDGTSTSVKEEFPSVDIIAGTGTAFWAKSMQEAERHVLFDRSGHATAEDREYILWLNDDVVLDRDAFCRLTSFSDARPDSIIIGAVRDPSSHEVTYSGFRRIGRHPLRLKLIKPGPDVLPVDTFNGNLVLIPSHIARTLGGIDGEYGHALADIDYGYRAGLLGVPVLLVPGTYGFCPRNPQKPWLGIKAEWKEFIGVKGGGHPASLRKILKVGAPLSHPVYFLGTYIIWWFRAFKQLALSRKPLVTGESDKVGLGQ
ncbi:glycosyltransferase family 2 protein [Paenarthrobacter sp. 22069]|uniref:glycosyltransferase family 2 protein n=1 Tax=Paenarthrobacter sp. 22069 TaxID=3453864 RepID=UPI003F8652E2